MSGTSLERMKASRSNKPDQRENERPCETGSADDTMASDTVFKHILTALEPLTTVDAPVYAHAAISRDTLEQFWRWVQRDLDPKEMAGVTTSIGGNFSYSDAELDVQLARIAELVEPKLAIAEADSEYKRRLSIQIGGQDVYDAVPTIVTAFTYLPFIRAGYKLGQELNASNDVAVYGYALERAQFPTESAKKLWCVAFLAGTSSVELLAKAITGQAHVISEPILKKSGLCEYMDAYVIQAQKQVETIERQSGLFKDVDLICNAVARFHQLVRCLQRSLGLPKSSSWILHLEKLIVRSASSMRGAFDTLVNDVGKVLQPAKDGAPAHLDPEDVLHAYNGLYVLAAARIARESLALNVIIERSWQEIAQVLEYMVERLFENYKSPAGYNACIAAQIDLAIRFCAIRFGEDHAGILKRNKLNIERRINRSPVSSSSIHR